MSLKIITTRVLVAGLIVISVLWVALRYAESRDFFFPEIASLLEDSTGYTLKKSGQMEVDLFPLPEVTFRSLALSNPYSQLGAHFFRAEALSLRLDWASVLRLEPMVDVDIQSADLTLEMDKEGNPNWVTPKLIDGQGGAPVKFDRLSASGLRFRFKNHQTDEIFGLDIDRIDSDIEGGLASTTINSAGQFRDQRFLAQGEVGYQRADKRIDIDLQVSVAPASQIKVAEVEVASISDWIEKRKTSFPINGSILGSVTVRESLPHGQLQFHAEAHSLGDITFLGETLNYLQADLGPVLADGKLRIRGSDLDIDELQVGIEQEQAGIDVHGSVQNLLSQIRLKLHVRGWAARLEQLLTTAFRGGQTTVNLSQLESIKFTSSLDYEGSDIELNGLEVDFRHHSLKASIAGDLHIREDVRFSDLEVAAEIIDQADLLDLFGVEDILPPDFGPIKVQGRVKSENDSHTIEGGTFDAPNVGLKGSISGALDASAENLYFDLEPLLHIKELALIAQIYSGEVAPYLQDFSGKATGQISGSPKDFVLKQGVINLFREDRELNLSGQLAGLPDNLESDFTFQYLTTRPFELDRYFSQLEGLQLTGPMELSGALRSTGKLITIENARLQAQQTDVKGEAKLDMGVSPPQITASFTAESFVTDLFYSSLEAEPEEVAGKAPEADAETGPEPKVETDQQGSAQELAEAFKAYTSSILINSDWIEALNLFISFTAEKARIGDYVVDDLSAVVSARDGVFILKEYEFLLAGEPINISGLIDSNPELPRYELKGRLMGDTLPSVLNMEGGLVDGGELQGEFKLKSNGNTLGELIEHLNGQATVEMGPLTLRSRILNTVSSGIFGTMLNGILRKNSDEAVSVYQCGVVGIDVQNGIANIERTLTLQAEDYNLGGSGHVDLNTGYVDLRVVPRARKGLGLSISTIVGGFRVRGHMATPDLGLGGGSLLTAAVLGYALAPTVLAGAMVTPVTATVVATGYLAQGLIHRMTASNFTCENTLKRIQSNRAKLAKSSGKSVPDREF